MSPSDIAGRVIENENLANFPNWLALEFRIADQDWFDARTVTLLSYRQDHVLAWKHLWRAFQDHVLAWKHLWRAFDVHIQPADPGFKGQHGRNGRKSQLELRLGRRRGRALATNPAVSPLPCTGRLSRTRQRKSHTVLAISRAGQGRRRACPRPGSGLPQ